MRVTTLASSSKGNCTLIWTDNTKILIDLGITTSECELKLQALGIDPSSIDAICSTHNHSDHTKGISTFVRKYGTKVYVHVDGVEGLISKLTKVPASNVMAYTGIFEVGEFTITPFKLPHDAPCCVGYSVQCGDAKVSYATDLGHITDEIVSNLAGSTLVILESNHDKSMLIANPHYPAVLKSRIMGPNGHLCNADTASVVYALALSGTKQVVLAHLSEENNTPDTAYNTVCEYLSSKGLTEGEHIRVDVAPAYKIGTIFKI